ncbi:MAG TPA: site-specific DNA-methyltransferase [Phycisphaerales bacterium]|nr:site-specific DNA-methyltransferase [Phycisphaerales bacterium]
MTDRQGKNLLCFGDNLDFLRDTSLLPDESVDLIYLDPPFNSQQNYNVLFKETTGTPAAAQIKAFEDTWTWDSAANDALVMLHQDSSVPAPLVDLSDTLMKFLKATPMMAYLVQMAVRLVHMHRVLKPAGSLYLHCDPTASHYLKLILDAIFGPTRFLNEIVWKRHNARSTSGKWPSVHDTLLVYVKGDSFTYHGVLVPGDTRKIPHTLITGPDGTKYQTYELTAPGKTQQGESGKPWHGFDPSAMGRHWANSHSTMDEWDAAGLIHWPKNNGFPRRKDEEAFVPEARTVTVGDVWIDIDRINQTAKERLGYPTQKPLELLKRIISASSNPGDVVLDPFCGCGTTIDAVETLNRENAKEPPRTWIGIDITHLSINLIKHRLTRFKDPPVSYEVLGEPASVSGAEALAQQDPFQFQFWALGLLGARPAGGRKKKGADQGIDGVRYFVDEQVGGAWTGKTMLVQVKSGKVGAKDIRDLAGTMGREKAELAVFVTLQAPTQPMRTEAAAAGSYISPYDRQAYPRVQIVTIDELLRDPQRPNPRCVRVPGGAAQHTLPEAPKHKARSARQGTLGFEP